MNSTLWSFKLDITPPVGGYLCGGLWGRSQGIESRIYVRGTVLEVEGVRHALAVFDFTWICGGSHRRLVDLIAKATGADADRVSVHTVHQHDAPSLDEDTHGFIREKTGLQLHNEDYGNTLHLKLSQCLAELMKSPGSEVAGVSGSRGLVNDFASNRRLMHDGKYHGRGSKCQNPMVKALPEGDIDPWLRQFAFWGKDGALLATYNFYASHPQVADGRHLISSDAPGRALELMEEKHPGATHLYFNGCGADIANGKYAGHDRTADIHHFGRKLFHAMDEAMLGHEVQALESFAWSSDRVSLPIRASVRDMDRVQSLSLSESEHSRTRYINGRSWMLMEKGMDEYSFRFSMMNINGYSLCFLPGEMLLGYQHYIGEYFEDREVFVAAYGDSFIGYVPLDKDFEIGGYEAAGGWTFVRQGCEQRIKSLIRSVGGNVAKPPVALVS